MLCVCVVITCRICFDMIYMIVHSNTYFGNTHMLYTIYNLIAKQPSALSTAQKLLWRQHEVLSAV